jgi:chromosome segregation ATPase
MRGESDEDRRLQEQVDDLKRQVSANRADIDALESRADATNHRADVSEERADVAQERADTSEARADADHLRIDELERRVDVDQEMIAELQAEGVLSREHAEQMQDALRSSRRIGAAMGVIMKGRNVSEEAAFMTLAKASQRANRKLRDIAEDVVRDLDVSDLPHS